jgi:hypothetical protein
VSKRRRRSRTARGTEGSEVATTTAAAAAPAAAAPAADAAAEAAAPAAADSPSASPFLSCLDVLGRDVCHSLPLPRGYGVPRPPPPRPAASSSSTAANDSSSSSGGGGDGSDSSGFAPVFKPGVTGDYIWVILDDGSWVIPVRRGAGRKLESLEVLWLKKGRTGYVPQLEKGVGTVEPLPGIGPKPKPLQQARVSCGGGCEVWGCLIRCLMWHIGCRTACVFE